MKEKTVLAEVKKREDHDTPSDLLANPAQLPADNASLKTQATKVTADTKVEKTHVDGSETVPARKVWRSII